MLDIILNFIIMDFLIGLKVFDQVIKLNLLDYTFKIRYSLFIVIFWLDFIIESNIIFSPN